MKLYLPLLLLSAAVLLSGCAGSNQFPRPPSNVSFNAPAQLPDAYVDVAYSYSFCQPPLTSASQLCDKDATNPVGGHPPYHFQLDSGVGFQPFGLSLNQNGLLAGAPTIEGSRTFRVCAVDLDASQACQTVAIDVKQAPGGVSVEIIGEGRVYSSPTRDIDCPPKCSGTLSDEFPFLNARAADGWFFSDWEGAPGCFTDSCPLTPKDLREPLNIKAIFEYVGE
ncbi:hypothetical protein HYS54_03875 [Candidatus Micrarchaeota archaeon]|nr:hypothetical protein [Candidatus Micrarchaeota archaeon]